MIAESCKQPLTTPNPVDVRAKEDRTEWPHQKTGAEGHEGQHQ